MSNYSVLKQDINNNIYENQTQQITGTVLNAILNEMTASLGAGYQFAGVATVGMNPGDPDQRVFYLAGEGIYTSFGGIQVPAGKLGVLKWDNRWTLQTIDGLGGGGANLTGYVSVASTDDLPDEGQPTLGYLCGTNLYLYVGEGGDTKEGKYQDCGSFRGPEGAYIQDIEQTETSHENGGRNTIKMTLSDGRSFNAYVHNGTTSSGLFPTLAALQAAYPTPVVGQYAFVGAGFPADIYVCTTAGTWTDSGEDYDGDNVDLTDYATKAEVNQLEAKVTDFTGNFVPLYDGVKISGGLNASGAVVSTSWTYTSPFIPVIPKTPIYYDLRSFSASLICFYSSNDASTFISAIPAKSTTSEQGMAFVPSGAKYIRFSAVDFTNSYIYTSDLGLANLASNLYNKQNGINGSPITTGYYINANGEAVSSSMYGYYSYPVVAGAKLKVFASVSPSNSSLFAAFFDKNDNYINDSAVQLSSHALDTVELTAPEDAAVLKVSFKLLYQDHNYCYQDITPVLAKDPFNERIFIPLTITSADTISQSSAPFCPVTKSNGIKVTGTGNATITLTFGKAVPSGNTISYAVKIPYATQDVATVTLSGGNAIGIAGTSPKTKSGKMYKMQGECYQRVNIPASTDISSTTIVIASEESWEIWVSAGIVVNDTMPLAPICYIYDGGHWDGQVVYNGTPMSIWSLHRLLGIPYTIANTGNAAMEQEVINDIESGFAEIITRIGGHNNTLYKQADNLVIDGIIAECREHESDNMGAVLATHAFDKDVLRCIKMSGVEFLRTYPTYDGVEKYGSRFGDYDLLMISGHSVSSNSLIPSTFMGFPVILWAHGVGDPQSEAEQQYIDFYEDKTIGSHIAGSYTIAGMEKILAAQALGNAAAMKASDFIAYCKKEK